MYSYVILDMYNFVPNNFNNYANTISCDNTEDYNNNIKHKKPFCFLATITRCETRSVSRIRTLNIESSQNERNILS